MNKKEMPLTLVNLVKREVEKSTESLIHAESELAGMKVRYEFDQKNVNELLKMRNSYSDQVKYAEKYQETCKKELECWSQIQDFVTETFMNNS